MLLQSLKLKNFRQFVDEKIDFSTDKERNVTLIIGENGTGKTTFAQAFFWCLYGETDFKDKIMINRSVAEKMLPDQKEEVRVELNLKHGSANYDIIRTQEYKKGYNNKLIPANTILNIARKNESGNTKYLKPLECESEIKSILPKELSPYFFFDGERIEKMSKEIASGKKSSGFAEAVAGLTGLSGMRAAIAHLSPSKSNSVIGKLNASYVGDSTGTIQQLNKEITELQEKIEKNELRLGQIETEISEAESSKAKYSEEIKQYAEAEKLQTEREKLEKDLGIARNTKAQFIKNLCVTFNDEFTSYISMSLVEKALKALADNDMNNKDIPEMHSKTIEYLVKRGTCICGTQLMEGSVPYKNVMELMDYLPPQSIGVTVGQFIKESRALYSSKPNNLYEDVASQLGVISSQDEMIDNIYSDLDQISAKLDGDNVKEQVGKLNDQIKACSNTITRLSNEQKTLLIKQGELATKKNLKENTRSELSLLDNNNQQIERLKIYAMRLYEELSSEYTTEEAEIRNKLQESINEIFLSIYNGGLSLQIDEKYNISVFVNDPQSAVETSSAQSIAVMFAFITAIIKMARDNQEKKGDMSYSEPYPLVMDAPLSAFDKKRIKAICDSIPKTAEQVIIFIKDTDGDLAEEQLGTKVLKRHYLEKIDEFNTRLN